MTHHTHSCNYKLLRYILHFLVCTFKMLALYALVLLSGSSLRLATGQNASLSAFALKMMGVCTKPSDLANYKPTCVNSSSTIFPNTSAKPPPMISGDDSMSVEKQNEFMLMELINRGVHNSKVPPHLPKYGFDQLSTMFGIYSKVCPEVPPQFLQNVYHLYSFIHWKTATDRREYLKKKHHKWIMRLLNNCSLNAQPEPLLTDSCRETVFAVGNCTTYICTRPEYEFRLMKADPIVDVVFKVLEMTHSVCFPEFRESYRMFHFMHLTVADTFTDAIKKRWTKQVADHRFWKRLLGAHYESHLIHIERCNAGIIPRTKFPYRILRTSMPAQIRLTGTRSQKLA